MTVPYFVSKFESVRGEFKELTNINYPSGAIGQNKIRDILRNSLTSAEKEIIGIK